MYLCVCVLFVAVVLSERSQEFVNLRLVHGTLCTQIIQRLKVNFFE